MPKLTTGGPDGAQSARWAKEEGFSHVASEWIEKGTISYDEALERLAQKQRESRDVTQKHDRVQAVNHEGNFRLLDLETGKHYSYTPWTIENKTSYWCGTSQNMFSDLLDKKHPRAGKDDQADYSCVDELVSIWNKRKAANKEKDGSAKRLLFRFNESDRTCRAILSEGYSILDNEWFVKTFMEIIPEGRVSHYTFDGDNVDFNVLIPDSLRKEDWTEFGAMVHGFNSEIGDGRIGEKPGVFTHICMNGCIWNRKDGEGISKVHRGKLDYDELRSMMIESINQDIPLATQHIDDLLNSRSVKWDTKKNNDKSVLGALSEYLKFDKTVANRVLDGYITESGIYEGAIGTVYGLVNSITRASQTFIKENPAKRYQLDNIASQVVSWNQEDMNNLVAVARRFDEKKLEKIYGVLS